MSPLSLFSLRDQERLINNNDGRMLLLFQQDIMSTGGEMAVTKPEHGYDAQWMASQDDSPETGHDMDYGPLMTILSVITSLIRLCDQVDHTL